jgi:hypothetical protein
MPMRMHPHELLLFEVAHFRGTRDPRLLDHLRRCPECGERLLALVRARGREAAAGERRALPSPPARPCPGPAAEAVRRNRRRAARRAAIVRERAEAPALLAALADHPPARQQVILTNHARFQTWGVLELLVERAGAARPEAVEPLAGLALELAGHLDPQVYGAEMIADMCARAWALSGHARQATGDLDGAEAAFATAHLYLRRGTGDALERAFLLGLKAGLRAARGSLAEAERLLARAARLFLTLGDPQRAGSSLVRLAEVRERAGDLGAAIEALYRALDLVDPEEEPELILEAWQSLLSHLAACGRFMEARRLLARSRGLVGRFPDAPYRASWIKGKIARGLRQDAEAEAAWLAARCGFLAAGAELEAARVALDLAALYAEQGRIAELHGLAEEMVPAFTARQLEREVRAALAYLWQAAEAGWPPSTTAKTSAAASE